MQLDPVIYEYRNSKANGVYIGSTLYCQSRWKRHIVTLRKGTHHSRHLQNAFNKYGEQSFSFAILEQIEDLDHLIERENAWIQMERDRGSIIYNVAPVAGTVRGIKRSDETRRAMSLSARKVHPGLRGPDGKEYPHIIDLSEFCKEHGIVVRNIYYITSKGRGNHRGWTLLSGDPTPPKRTRIKALIAVSPDGTEYTVRNISKFNKAHGLNGSGLLLVADGKSNHHHGWTAYHEGDTPKPPYTHILKVYRFRSPNGEIVECNNLRTIEEKYGLSQGHLSSLHSSKLYQFKGWTAVDGPERPIRRFFFRSPSGEIYETRSIKEFAEAHNLGRPQLSMLHSGKRSSYFGWTAVNNESPE